MKSNKDDKNSKAKKKIVITLIFVIVFLFTFSGCVSKENSDNSTTIDNETESKTEDKKENEEVDNIEGEKTITEDEKRYYEQAKPYIDTILSDFNVLNELAEQQNRDETWKVEMSELAQKFIEDGLNLENLSNNESARPLSDLAGLFGVNIKFAGENLSDWLSGGNQEDYEDWEMCVNDANCYLQELNFYYITGVTLQEQLENDIKAQVGEEFVDSISISSGGSVLGILIKQKILEDTDSTKSLSHMEIYDLLKMLSKNPYYNYLDIIIKLQDTIQINGEDKNFIFMEAKFSTETRKNIDFNNISWSQIQDIADNYIDRI